MSYIKVSKSMAIGIGSGSQLMCFFPNKRQMFSLACAALVAYYPTEELERLKA